jgi:hypothetical protein
VFEKLKEFFKKSYPPDPDRTDDPAITVEKPTTVACYYH